MTVDAAVLGTIFTSLDQRIVHTDDRYEEIVGREQSDLVGRSALSFTYSADLAGNKPVLDRLAVGGPGFTITKRYVQGGGALVWVRNHVSRFNDGVGQPILCATTQRISRPFGTDRLLRNYRAAQRLCQGLIVGRRQLSADIVWAPAIEALLWLYRAEIEGSVLDIDRVASMAACPSSAMLRWIKLLHERRLVSIEGEGLFSSMMCVRISAHGERTLDGLLSGLTD